MYNSEWGGGGGLLEGGLVVVEGNVRDEEVITRHTLPLIG